ncbi:MAG: transposase [Armatimonadota bacterium]
MSTGRPVPEIHALPTTILWGRRAARVIADFMGDAMPEVWLSDCFSAQPGAPTGARQLGHAHQLRDLQFAVDAERSEFAYRMQRLLLRAQGLAKRRADLPPDVFADQVRDIENLCEHLLSGPVAGRHARRLQRHYRKHREALFTSLYRADVSPDNNACERALRKSVVHRKVSSGFHSEWGAAAGATMATVIETAAQRGEDALHTLTNLLTPGASLLPLPQPP